MSDFFDSDIVRKEAQEMEFLQMEAKIGRAHV